MVWKVRRDRAYNRGELWSRPRWWVVVTRSGVSRCMGPSAWEFCKCHPEGNSVNMSPVDLLVVSNRATKCTSVNHNQPMLTPVFTLGNY